MNKRRRVLDTRDRFRDDRGWWLRVAELLLYYSHGRTRVPRSMVLFRYSKLTLTREVASPNSQGDSRLSLVIDDQSPSKCLFILKTPRAKPRDALILILISHRLSLINNPQGPPARRGNNDATHTISASTISEINSVSGCFSRPSHQIWWCWHWKRHQGCPSRCSLVYPGSQNQIGQAHDDSDVMERYNRNTSNWVKTRCILISWA